MVRPAGGPGVHAADSWPAARSDEEQKRMHGSWAVWSVSAEVSRASRPTPTMRASNEVPLVVQCLIRVSGLLRASKGMKCTVHATTKHRPRTRRVSPCCLHSVQPRQHFAARCLHRIASHRSISHRIASQRFVEYGMTHDRSREQQKGKWAQQQKASRSRQRGL